MEVTAHNQTGSIKIKVIIKHVYYRLFLVLNNIQPKT
jgi:hypothetical protein